MHHNGCKPLNVCDARHWIQLGIGQTLTIVMFLPQLDNGEEETLVTTQKIKSEMGKQQGSFTIASSGAITFTFDKSYSLLNSKTVTYTVSVMNMSDMKAMRELVADA